MLQLNFSISDNNKGKELNLNDLDLTVLPKFLEQVYNFLRGSNNNDLTNLKIGLESGSAVVTVKGSEPEMQDVVKDYTSLQDSNDLSHLDKKRASVIKAWQQTEAVNKNKRTYNIFYIDNRSNAVKSRVEISKKTNYKLPQTWVEVEKYLYGQIFDMGGKNNVNVHITLENGQTLKVNTNKPLLAGEEENRLYKDQLLRVKAWQDIDTKELDGDRIELISFEAHDEVFDKSKYDKLAHKTAEAWKDVPDVNKWVEEGRGNIE